jgi:hypothetical protein
MAVLRPLLPGALDHEEPVDERRLARQVDHVPQDVLELRSVRPLVAVGVALPLALACAPVAKLGRRLFLSIAAQTAVGRDATSPTRSTEPRRFAIVTFVY